MNQDPGNDRFDRDYNLAELLPATLLAPLGAALSPLLGDAVAIVAADGGILWGRETAGNRRLALTVELEPLGFLSADADPDRLQATAALLRQLLLVRTRYLMASNLHTESVAADFAALQAKHAALTASEARYKALAANLEQQVATQVELLNQRQSQLYQAEKLASVGQLAAGVAHEINNPISFVRSNIASLGGYLGKLRELKGRLGEGPQAWAELDLDFVLDDGADLVKDCLAGIDRVARIVRDLRGFSSIDRAEAELLDPNDSLRETLAVLAGQMPADIQVRLEAADLPKILCLPGHLNQVFLNVLRNAMQAIADSGHPGEIVVSTHAVADGVEIAIRDNGVGMYPEQMHRAFEPFYTTRAVGGGIGLGLSVAREAIKAHRGRIAIASAPDSGTTVTIFLPT